MAFDSDWLNEPYTPWRIEGLKLFLEHTLRHHINDVYFVRMIDIINWMKEPVGLKQMKQGYLADIAIRSNCHEQIDIDQQCLNEKKRTNSKSNQTGTNRSLFLIFDAVAEPLFRSNIVFYSTICFLIFLFVTFIYDRIFIH
jgi:hypothetical protein